MFMLQQLDSKQIDPNKIKLPQKEHFYEPLSIEKLRKMREKPSLNKKEQIILFRDYVQ